MRVASIQLEMADRPKGETIAHAMAAIDGVPAADLLLMPEIWPSGFFCFDRYDADAEPLDGPTVQAFRAKARERRCHLLMGSLVERRDGPRYNTSVFIGPDGDILADLPQNPPLRLPVGRGPAAHPRQRDRGGRHAVGADRLFHLL